MKTKLSPTEAHRRAKLRRIKLEMKLLLLEQQLDGHICLTCRYAAGGFGATTLCTNEDRMVVFNATCYNWKGAK